MTKQEIASVAMRNRPKTEMHDRTSTRRSGEGV